MPDRLEGGSSQPVQMTEVPASLGMQLAILVERVDGLRTIINERESAMRRALELQAQEYERRLEALNGEARRIASVQSASVTSEKFDDYTRSQSVALKLALDAASKQTENRAERNAERIADLSDRVLRLETDERSRDKADSKDDADSSSQRDITTRWQVWAAGTLILIIVVIVNVVLALRSTGK